MNVLFFPANKLNASICNIYNGHTAIVSTNTDRLIDNKYAFAEICAFKHNIQCTSFLHAFGDTTAGENVNYGETLKAVKSTGRISFGLYWRSDMWVNPLTLAQTNIPDYNATTWGATGAATFKNAVQGTSKAVRYPNHGQQMYDISGGDFGYDMINGKIGASKLAETYLHTERQLDHIKEISGISLTSGSYTNGAQLGWNVLIPKFYGMRNSLYSYRNNDGNVKYTGLSRTEMMQEASTCRAWDATNAGQFTDQTAALNYSASELAKAINSNGWYSEFVHWHSIYDQNDLAYFDTFFSKLDQTIANADVWRAGNNEVNEYYVLANSINKIGSYVHDNKAFVFIRFKDMFTGTNTNGISDAINPTKISTPISISIDLSNTSLAGKSIASNQAATVRNLGSNKWIVNVSPIHTFKNGYMTFVIEEAADNKQVYATSRPVLTRSNNTVTSDREAKFVIWRKAINADDKTIDAVHRTIEFTSSLSYQFDTVNYKYYVGAISRSRNSSLIEI